MEKRIPQLFLGFFLCLFALLMILAPSSTGMHSTHEYDPLTESFRAVLGNEAGRLTADFLISVLGAVGLTLLVLNLGGRDERR
jgi:hypothetical protein